MLTTIDYGRMTALSKSAFAALFDLLHGQELTIEQITAIASHAADTVELGLRRAWDIPTARIECPKCQGVALPLQIVGDNSACCGLPLVTAKPTTLF